ncbi:GNAT family N-acetyltransferase [filamentous cyanobacterium CCP5]|nr:GNAT family N-acetyltransferase [filamentous cyanobacterium CCP5]
MALQTVLPYSPTLELVPLQPDHIPAISRICYAAFSGLQSRHRIHVDIPDVETAGMIISHVANRPDYTGVVAILDGQVVGSNFLLHADEVAGVGPITVDPTVQSQGIGRSLMAWATQEVQRRGIRQVRLFQEAVNAISLSLYTSVGFAWRDSAALMQAVPAAADSPLVRPLGQADLPAVAALSRQAYGFSRASDAAQLLAADFPGFILERQGVPAGYWIASLFGHGCAETDEDLLTLVGHGTRHLPPPFAVFICPLSRAEGFRRCLQAGHRTLKMLSYMSYGDFVAPSGLYLPSIQC